MYDYRGWAERAYDFTRGLADRAGATVASSQMAPPLPRSEVDRIGRELGRPIPLALRAFLELGSGNLDCRYTFEPDPETGEWERFAALFPDQTYIYGGARLCNASELPSLALSSAAWARDTWISDDRDQRALWDRALPIADVPNGDFLALDLSAPLDDPPVFYLSHDDESALLAPSLTAFLDAWEALCYVGPEIWLLDEFRGADGYLAGGGQTPSELRALLRSDTTRP